MNQNHPPPSWLFELNRQLLMPFTAADGVWCGTEAVTLDASASLRSDEPGLVDVRIALAPGAVRWQLPPSELDELTSYFTLGLKPTKSRATRVAACQALGNIATSTAQARLRPVAAGEPDELVRIAANHALHNSTRPVVDPASLSGVPFRLLVRGESGEELKLERVTDAAGHTVFSGVPAGAACQLRWEMPGHFSGLWPLLEGLRLVACGCVEVENENWKVQVDFQPAPAGVRGDLMIAAKPVSAAAKAEAPPGILVQGRGTFWQPAEDWFEHTVRFAGIPASDVSVRLEPPEFLPVVEAESAFSARSATGLPAPVEFCRPVVVNSPRQGLVSILERTADGRVRVTVATELPARSTRELVCSLGGARGRIAMKRAGEGVWRGTTVLDRAWADSMLGAIRFQPAEAVSCP